MPHHTPQIAHGALRQATRPFEATDTRRALWQMATSFLPFLALCAAMYWSLALSYALTLALAVPAAGLVVRIFIIQHDCGHGSFLRARWANGAVGMACSLATFTPYAMWRRQHAGHHGRWNNLDCRQSGADIYSSCLTVAEYHDLPPRQRWRYRLMQHPLVAWILLPPLVFLVLYRVPFDTPSAWAAERRAVYLTDLALLALYGGLGLLVGFRAMALVQGPIMVIAAIIGVWLFSIQHRFERALWARQDVWSPIAAALEGSSHLDLPCILQWFTGNIGFHHVHHINPRIPNYRLEACQDACPALRQVPVMKPWQALRAWRAALWDEAAGRMVPFAAAAPARRPE